MNTRTTLPLLTSLIFVCGSLGVNAQNEAGTVHLGLGLGIGAHGTHYQVRSNTFILGESSERGGAVTFTIPITVQVGLARFMSLGLYIEPGAYADSSATRSNGLLLAGLSPRFYLVNKERVLWHGFLELGLNSLVIKDTDRFNNSFQDNYLGGHLRLGTGLSLFFGERVGLNFNTRFTAANMALRKRELNGADVNLDNYDAQLDTRGLQFDLGLALKF